MAISINKDKHEHTILKIEKEKIEFLKKLAWNFETKKSMHKHFCKMN